MVGALLSVALACLLAAGGTIVCWTTVASMAARRTPRWLAIAIAFEVASLKRSPQRVIVVVFGIAAASWFLVAVGTGMGPLTELLSFPIVGCGSLFALKAFVGFKTARRRAQFLDQLEMALRLISGGIRVGLSLPQAMAQITAEMKDPALTEFYRVIGQTRIGTATADALDDLAERIPSSETTMLARVVRVQAQTGGSLSVILDHLAETIKDRRRIARKIAALTAEGRTGALVLELLPVGVGLAIILIERPMGQALLGTLIGHLVLGLVVVLELLAIWSLNRMLQVQA